MGVFAFQSRGGASVSPSGWLTTWSNEFDPAKYPEDVYEELVARGTGLSGADFDVLGAWKDGAVRHGGKIRFSNCSIYFTDAWKADAVVAYTVWRNLPQSLSVLREFLAHGEYGSFLNHLAKQQFRKRGRNGLAPARFGLPRATYVLHVFSHGEFPIYDTNTHLGIYFLTQRRYGTYKVPKMKTQDPDWYLKVFCSIVRDLQEVCGAQDRPSQRSLDKALFCYGKTRK